jgi:lipoyl(octanoyl) transferase
MLLIEPGLTEYLQSLDIQRKIVARKLTEGGEDVLLLLEHPPTVTLGIRGKTSSLVIPEEELVARGIAVHKVDRGGEATYHGHGQLVAYAIISLKGLGLTARAFVHGLEETVLTTLQYYGIDGFRHPGKPGVWTGSCDKIASIGVRIRRGVTYHGFSLNVSLEQDPTEFTVLCGMPEARMVSLSELIEHPVSMDSVREIVAQSFGEVFGVTMERGSLNKALTGLP